MNRIIVRLSSVEAYEALYEMSSRAAWHDQDPKDARFVLGTHGPIPGDADLVRRALKDLAWHRNPPFKV